METFSNNREEYWNQIKKELSETNDLGNFQLQYIEIGQLLSHGFSITLTEQTPQKLTLKTWNAEYDNNRFDKGIFNLDRLAITERKIELNSQELDSINRLLHSNLERTNKAGVILDGLWCQLKTNDILLNWNTNDEINEGLTELIELLRNKMAYYTI